jgi:hypothetical protein
MLGTLFGVPALAGAPAELCEFFRERLEPIFLDTTTNPLNQSLIWIPATATLAVVDRRTRIDLVLLCPHDGFAGLGGFLDPVYTELRVRIAGIVYQLRTEELTAWRGEPWLEERLAHFQQQVTQRAMNTLLHRAGSFGVAAKRVAYYLLAFRATDLPITQFVIGDALDHRRETISEVLADFADRHWVEKSRSCITILNRDALTKFAATPA